MGTVAYMSREQARDENLDARTDIFSFGAVLYEMASGRQAFSGSMSAVMFHAILERDPVSETDFDALIPNELRAIISKALEKDCELRYQHAVDICADLKRDRSFHSSPAVQVESGETVSRSKVCAAFTLLLTVALLMQAADQQLFIIERTTNGNVVHYDAHLNSEGHIDPGQPVIVYWTIGSTTGKRQNLNYLERTRAYGIQVRPKSGGRYVLTVVSQKELEIDVYEDGGRIRAETTIDGHHAYLKKIFANIESTLFLPKVHYVELFGTDVSTGIERYQKIIAK
jgi:serine/threonine protein kinase